MCILNENQFIFTKFINISLYIESINRVDVELMYEIQTNV